MQVRYQVELSSILAHDAFRYRDDLDPVWRGRHVDHPQLTLAERGDIGLGHGAVIEDMMCDEICGQGNVHENLAEIIGFGIYIDNGYSFLPLGRTAQLEGLQVVLRLAFVIHHGQDFRLSQMRRSRQKHRVNGACRDNCPNHDQTFPV